MRLFFAFALVASFSLTAMAEEWEYTENGLVMITFGPEYDYKDDFIIHKGAIEGSEWVFKAIKPAQSTLVSTKKVGKKIGTDTSRKFTIGAIAHLKFDWSGPCFVYNEAPAFFVDLTFENMAGVRTSRSYELAMDALPDGLCKDDGTAIANTMGKYEPYGLVSMDFENDGPIKDIQVSLRRAVKNTSINLQYFRLVLGHSKYANEYSPDDIKRALSPAKGIINLQPASERKDQGKNLMDCVEGSSIVTNCELQNETLSEVLSDETFGNYETDYKVRYIFDCPGQVPLLGFNANPDKSLVAISTANEEQVATVIGTEKLRAFDPDPEKTRGLMFKRKCEFRVKAIEREPSLGETLKWREDALTQHKILKLAYNMYLIVSNMEAVNEWDKDQIAAVAESITAILKDRLLKNHIVVEAAKPSDMFVSPQQYRANLVAQNPEMGEEELEEHAANYMTFLEGDTLDLITLLYFTESIVKDRPVGTNPTIGDAVKAAKKADSLKEKVKKELMKEHQMAIAMIERSNKYKVEILKELEVLAGKIETLP